MATHPQFDHIVAGGSDGLPKVYRIFREVKREIGDDAQFIADLFPMTGRVFSVRFSADGKRIACGSGLDRAGELLVCSYDYTNDVPKALRDIMGKVPGRAETGGTKATRRLQEAGHSRNRARRRPKSAHLFRRFQCRRQTHRGRRVRMAWCALFNATNGAVVKEFVSVPLAQKTTVRRSSAGLGNATNQCARLRSTPESLAGRGKNDRLGDSTGRNSSSRSPNDYAQLLVTAQLDSGDTVDVTRMVKFAMKPAMAEISPHGASSTPVKNGTGKLTGFAGRKTAEVPLEIAGLDKGYHADFIRDVSPVISQPRLQCRDLPRRQGRQRTDSNFRLRGYDPETDLRALTDDLASRRVNLASPDDSLMLLKAVAEVPHEGGRRTTVDSKYYEILRQWIAEGATLDMKSPRVAKIELFPQDPVVQKSARASRCASSPLTPTAPRAMSPPKPSSKAATPMWPPSIPRL